LKSKAEEIHVRNLKSEHQAKLAKVEEEKLKVATAAEQAEIRKHKFFETINSSTDLNENL
jgi:hypothetical protein